MHTHKHTQNKFSFFLEKKSKPREQNINTQETERSV